LLGTLTEIRDRWEDTITACDCNNKRIGFDIGFANLVVEHYVDEFVVYLRDKETENVIQDIALVREAIEGDEAVECLVWSNCKSGDYTHKFTIANSNSLRQRVQECEESQNVDAVNRP